jgi:uncharacterized protein (TIGR03437 family)
VNAVRICIIALLASACFPARAAIRILAIVNAASFDRGLPLGGGMAAIICTGLTGVSGYVSSDTIPLPLELAGISVKVRSVPAPLFSVYSSETIQQITFQVPWERDDGTLPFVEVAQNGEYIRIAFVDWTRPAFFTDNQHYAIARRASDDSLVTREQPAHPGETIIVYATGYGQVYPPVGNGDAAPAEPISTPVGSALLSSFIDGPCSLGAYNSCIMKFGKGDVASASETVAAIFGPIELAPGMIAVYRMHIQLPNGLPAGDLQFVYTMRVCTGPFGDCGSPYFFPVVEQVVYRTGVKIPVR